MYWQKIQGFLSIFIMLDSFFLFSIWKQWETLLEHGCISGMKMVMQRNGYEEMKGFLECCICCLHVGKPKKSLGSFWWQRLLVIIQKQKKKEKGRSGAYSIYIEFVSLIKVLCEIVWKYYWWMDIQDVVSYCMYVVLQTMWYSFVRQESKQIVSYNFGERL